MNATFTSNVRHGLNAVRASVHEEGTGLFVSVATFTRRYY